jgi:hypothetical protein
LNITHEINCLLIFLGTPFLLEQFISDTWAVDPDSRGDCAGFLKRINRWSDDYESDKATWDQLVKNL